MQIVDAGPRSTLGPVREKPSSRPTRAAVAIVHCGPAGAEGAVARGEGPVVAGDGAVVSAVPWLADVEPGRQVDRLRRRMNYGTSAAALLTRHPALGDALRPPLLPAATIALLAGDRHRAVVAQERVEPVEQMERHPRGERDPRQGKEDQAVMKRGGPRWFPLLTHSLWLHHGLIIDAGQSPLNWVGRGGRVARNG